MESDSCHCGVVVFEKGDLDELGLCLLCAGSGHEWTCACLDCSAYREELDAGASPADALAKALSIEGALHLTSAAAR